MATVEVPEYVGLQILKKGRLRVGLVYCRVKLETPKVTRGFYCYGYDHRVVECTRLSRRENCMTCGGQGHQAKGCGRPPNCVFYEELRR